MTQNPLNFTGPESSSVEFQNKHLQGVSRTFALAIPQLPERLSFVVANAYLLCRIVDTIEDEVSLNYAQKKVFNEQFILALTSGQNAQLFANELGQLLSDKTTLAEHHLIQESEKVLAITQSFSASEKAALLECVRTMTGGMSFFQSLNLKQGLTSTKDLDQYCYFVAGCVGEMLAKLFTSTTFNPNQLLDSEIELLDLAKSFGQGLQMTNILKDIWDDAEREVCWLPQEIFNQFHFNLSQLQQARLSAADELNFQKGLHELIQMASIHLQKALLFIQKLSAQNEDDKKIRHFCCWILMMALFNLHKIKTHIDFKKSSEVKISRRVVKITFILSKILSRWNFTLKLMNQLTGIFFKI